MTLLIVIISQRGGDILEAVYSTMVPREGGGVVGGSRKVRGRGTHCTVNLQKGGRGKPPPGPGGAAMLTSQGGAAQARQCVAWRAMWRGAAPWRRRPRWEVRGGEGRGGGRVQQRGAGVSCAHQHNTNQFGSSHTAGQQASPKCTGARTIAARHTDRQTRVSNGVYRSQGRDTYSQPVKVT